MPPTPPPLPKPEPPASRHPMLAPAVAIAVILAANIVSFKYLRSMPDTGECAVFHRTEGGWERMWTAPGLLDEIHVSGRGTVWVLAPFNGGFVRLAGAQWRSYTAADLGMKTGYLAGGFVLDGEDVWAATHEGVVHWDGQRWRCYREAFRTPGTEHSIAAGGGRAWAIDPSGSLSQFDGTRWTTWRLELPGVSWDRADRGRPKLARTADGSLFLVRDGVWRLDGSKWVALTPESQPLRGAWLVGTTGDRVWLWEQGKLRSVSANGKTWSEYPLPSAVYAVASDGRRTWLAAWNTILQSDGAAWRTLPLPGGRFKNVVAIDVGPDGGLWMVGLDPNPALRQQWYWRVAIAWLPLIALIAALVWLARRSSRLRRREQERIRQAVQHATGEVPYELEQAQRQSQPWLAGLALGGAIVGGIVGYSLLHHRWPKTPAWTIVVIALAIHLAFTFQQSLAKRKPSPSDPIGPGAPPRYDWGKTAKALVAALVILLVVNLEWVPVLRFLQGYWLVVLFLAPVGYRALAIRAMYSPLRRADYDGALRAIRLYHFYSPGGGVALRQSGAVLLVAGRYREAEEVLRRAAARQATGLEQAGTLDYLGNVLMEQSRYDEAMRSFQAARHAAPGSRRPYRGMAETLLRQGKNPEQALEYVEGIVGSSGPSARGRLLSDRVQDDYWALKAWALGQLGRSAEVAPAIEKALKATSRKSRPDLAATYYRAGMAMEAVGNASAARDYFKRAVELDPTGRRGTLAQAALRQTGIRSK